MKSTTRVVIACLSAAIIAASAFGQLSAQFTDWGKGPAQWIMTPDEAAKWKTIKTDADAKAFVDLFWARRDPTPATPVNGFKNEFAARVEFADQNFDQARKKGSMTERGRVYVVLGPPYKLQRSKSGPTSTIQTPRNITTEPPDQAQGYSPKQRWVYEQSQTKLNLGQPVAEVNFVDQYATNDWTLERSGRTNIDDLVKRTIQSYVVSANLTEAPKFTATAPPPPPQATQQLPPATTPPPAASVGAFKTEALKTAIAEFKGAKVDPYKDKHVAVNYTELLTPAGDFYTPVQLYIPKSANLTADAVTTFFGVIEDASGNIVAIFEEPAKLNSSKGDLYFDRSLNLKPGTYQATLGLAGADSKPVIIAASPMELKEINKDTAGISRLILAADVHETDEAAVAGSAYAFGKLKIVPKGDRVFTNKDEITYFLEVINPAVTEVTEGSNVVRTVTQQTSPTTSESISAPGTVTTTKMLPKLQVKLEMIQAPTGGKPGRTISAPISDATPLPLSATDGRGQYAIIASIPLGNMTNPLPPGDYTFRVKVFDQVGKQNWTAEQKLKLVAATPAATQ